MASFESAAATAIALAVLSGCFVLVRFVARIAFVKHVGPDDCLIMLAWAAAMALAIVTRQEVNNSSSEASSTGEESTMTNLLRHVWPSNITYNLAVVLLKDSLLLQYLRFSIDVGYRRACWAMGAIVTAYGVAALFVGIFSCRPVAYSWNFTISEGKCINFLAFWLFNASFNTATDIIVCVLPVPVLRALQLPKKQMVVLGSIFILGAFVCIASIVRLTAVYSAAVNNQNEPSIAIWSAIEVNIGIICACLPSLRHLMAQLWPRILAARRKLSSESQARTPTSMRPVSKYPVISIKSFDYRRSSMNSDSSTPRNSRIITFGTQPGGDDEEAITPDTATQPTIELENSQDWPSISAVLDSPQDDPNNKPLPLPPQLTIPPRAARPSGPRPSPIKTQSHPPTRPQIQTSPRSVKTRRPSRSLLPLACIPETQPQAQPPPESSPISLTRPKPQSISLSQASTATTSSTASIRSDYHHHDHDRTPLTRSPTTNSTNTSTSFSMSMIPTYTPHTPLSPGGTTISTLSSRDSTLSNIAPWMNACPASPMNKTYSYEILGGPRALANPSEAASGPNPLSPASWLTSSKSKRERARREQERARRKLREEERERERVSERERQIRVGERPKGPREMRGGGVFP